MNAITKTLAGIGLVFLFMTAFSIGVALGHSGSPPMTTFQNGQILTTADLNNSLAHIHNTLSGGIVDANVSSTAAIAHTKLATPSLVPKAWLSTTTACNGAGALGTDCTTGVEQSKFLSTSGGAGSGNSALEATGTAGTYNMTLSYTPVNANFVVLVTSGTTSVWCSVTGRATAAPQIQISCEDDTSTVQNTNIMVVVLDT